MKPRTATVGRKHLDPRTPVRGDSMVRDVFLQLCIDSNTPLAARAYQLYQEGDYDGLTSIKIDPFFYSWNGRGADFELDYQIASFFKKYQDFNLALDREALAYGKWLEAERSCSRINCTFRDRWKGLSTFPFHVEEVYHLTRRKITEILGTVGPSDLDLVRDRARHGPGADTSLRRSNSSGYAKYQSAGTITRACVDLYDDIFNTDVNDYRADFAHHAKVEHESKLSFVPKTARIDRAICIEPRWNVFLQLGIGELISKRLRRYGQDIRCQNRNQEAARRARSDGLATVDLSSASDSIATNLVVDLLDCGDPYWYDLLLKSRTPYTLYKGKVIRLEKISSMGNGYTFPLETLIFYSVAYAATRLSGCDTRQVTVYGDDIVVPRGAYSLLIETLACLGFSVNTDKSYASGDFFESCGKDYFMGREVRPFFVKKKIQTLFDAYTFHNQIVDWASRNQVLPGLLNYRRWLLAYKYVYRAIPAFARLCGPQYVGGVLHTSFKYWSARPAHNGLEGYHIRVLSARPLFVERYGYWGHLYSKLSSDLDCRNRVLRHGEPVYAVKEILVSHAPDFVLDEPGDIRSCAISA